MIAFFDTSIHIDLLTGQFSLDAVLREIGSLPVRICPIVASELLRGVSVQGRNIIHQLVRQLVSIEPPSWRQCWYDTGRLLPRIFSNYEEIGLSRLQNDVMLALTARHTGALFVTGDDHFDAIRRHVPFQLKQFRKTA
jgi:predicted nucleic acid-binding protein